MSQDEDADTSEMQSALHQEALVAQLRRRLPNLLAVYAFGSRIQGTASADSDLDLAVLVAGYAPPLELWALSGELADIAGCNVDLLDFRAASTVMQYQILTTGERWWAADAQAALYEAAVLSEKVELDAARAGLIADIEQRGRVYGR
jgi:predicted nucleotidyltransferase